MVEHYNSLLGWLSQHPELHSVLSLSLLLLGAWLANWAVKRILLRGLIRLLKSTALGQDHALRDLRIVSRLANIVPALVLSNGIQLVPALPEAVITVTHNVCSAFIVLTIALAIGNALNLANILYQRRADALRKPIKGNLIAGHKSADL